MKKGVLFLLCSIMLFSVCSCISYKDEVLSSIGKYSDEQFYSDGDFQDYTFYAKYTFKDINVDNNKYFSKVSKKDIETLNSYINNFEGWVQTIADCDSKSELVHNYDFDRNIISEEDYFYLYDKMEDPINELDYEQFDCYWFYILDTESNIVYYFHNNI